MGVEKIQDENILEVMQEQYPDSEKYPNKKTVNKDRVTAKLKQIRANFKKAADLGKKSGGGRIVFTYYDIFVKLYGEDLQLLLALIMVLILHLLLLMKRHPPVFVTRQMEMCTL